MGILCKERRSGGGDIFSSIFLLKAFADGDPENNFLLVVFVVISKSVHGSTWLHSSLFVVFQYSLSKFKRMVSMHFFY